MTNAWEILLTNDENLLSDPFTFPVRWLARRFERRADCGLVGA